MVGVTSSLVCLAWELDSNPPLKIVSRSRTEGDMGDRNGGSVF